MRIPCLTFSQCSILLTRIYEAPVANIINKTWFVLVQSKQENRTEEVKE